MPWVTFGHAEDPLSNPALGQQEQRRTCHPLLGERAGVRAVVKTLRPQFPTRRFIIGVSHPQTEVWLILHAPNSITGGLDIYCPRGKVRTKLFFPIFSFRRRQHPFSIYEMGSKKGNLSAGFARLRTIL